MRQNNPHVIRSQYLHVTVNGTETEGLALQHRLTSLCNDRLASALERALDRAAGSGCRSVQS
jgi:Contractile injection system tape measure protein